MSKVIYTGWGSLTQIGKPKDKFLRQNDVDVPQLIFPLHHSDLCYSIGSKHSNDIVLPPCKEKVPEIKIYVNDGNIEVVNESTPSSADSLKIFSRDWTTNKGVKKLTLPLKSNNEIVLKLGPYTVEYRSTAAPSAYYYKTMKDFVKCPSCSNIFKQPTSLPCGHMVCQTCVNKLVEEALENAEQTYVRQHYNRVQPEVSCPKCQAKTSIERIYVAGQRNAAVVDITSSMSRIFNYAIPKCVHCEGTRCYVAVLEYCICETCSNVFACPLCALDLHRDHKVRVVYSVMTEQFTAFDRASVVLKQTFVQIYQDYRTLYEASNPQLLLDYCQSRLNNLTTALVTLLKPAQETYVKLISSEYSRSAEETLELFQAEIMTLAETVSSLSAKIKELGKLFVKPEFAYSETQTDRSEAQLVDSVASDNDLD